MTKLSSDLKAYRDSEPNAYAMTSFIRKAEQLEREVEKLKLELIKSAKIIENMVDEAKEADEL